MGCVSYRSGRDLAVIPFIVLTRIPAVYDSLLKPDIRRIPCGLWTVLIRFSVEGFLLHQTD